MAEDEVLQAAMAVRRGATRLARRLRSQRAESAETLLELSVLGHLYRRGPMTPGALASAERLQPQSLTRALARLERDRLVLRRSDETDRRRSLLVLAEAGRLALTRDMARLDAWLAAAMARELTPAEQQLLGLAGDLMERLAEADDPGQSGRHDGSA
ncbi:MAG TPA: MarR family transcriptional regulator [Streptosporangiaceae bacterium]|nr:MarR family transcriptional regulator [Streptosporangiaceae bacterium]